MSEKHGRTVWQAQDAAWWRRERVVELGEEFGADGPAVANWLECEAKAQNDDGRVKTGYKSIARGAFIEGGVDQVRAVIALAVEIGFLKEFEEGGRTFTAVISAYAADQPKGRAALRQEKKRAENEPDTAPEQATAPGDASGQSVTDGDAVTLDVTASRSSHARGEERREEQQGADAPVEPTRLDDARKSSGDVERVFTAWCDSRSQFNGRKTTAELSPERRRLILKWLRTYPVDDLIDAVQGWQHSPHHRGENERNTVYNNLELLLRNAGQIEKFRDLQRGSADRRAPRRASSARLYGPSDEELGAA